MVYSQNSNNNNLPTRAIFRQQSRLYNKHLYTTAMATSLKWPSLYNDQLFTMATSLYNGYYSTKASCLYNDHLSTTATSLQWPNLYNGFVSNMATSLQWPLLYNQKGHQRYLSEELSDSLGLEEPPITLFLNFIFILSHSHEHISLFKPL